MADNHHTETSQALPYGATEIVLGESGFDETLARRLAEAGASDEAIDAAGGVGMAARLHEAAASRAANTASLAVS